MAIEKPIKQEISKSSKILKGKRKNGKNFFVNVKYKWRKKL
jgi:hypothetical protein